MANFSQHIGSIFTSNAQAICVTVNCEGFMGSGLALECSLRYSQINEDYKQKCQLGEIQIGSTFWYEDNISNKNSWIVLFPTKGSYKHPSKLDFITKGLISLKSEIITKKLTSIAIPRLGCDLGGLLWANVEPLIINSLSELEISVELWNYEKGKSDDFYPKIKSIVQNKDEFALKELGLSRGEVEKLKIFFEANPSGTLSKLLTVPGFGFKRVEKLFNKSHKIVINEKNQLNLF
jgi:O-acetyl-ADP-ribose deacetylase (regulator of RNase III)